MPIAFLLFWGLSRDCCTFLTHANVFGYWAPGTLVLHLSQLLLVCCSMELVFILGSRICHINANAWSCLGTHPRSGSQGAGCPCQCRGADNALYTEPSFGFNKVILKVFGEIQDTHLNVHRKLKTRRLLWTWIAARSLSKMFSRAKAGLEIGCLSLFSSFDWTCLTLTLFQRFSIVFPKTELLTSLKRFSRSRWWPFSKAHQHVGLHAWGLFDMKGPADLLQAIRDRES